MSTRAIIDALNEGDVKVVNMSREEARDVVDDIDHDDLLEALDNAQGEADTAGKTAYVVIAIKGAQL